MILSLKLSSNAHNLHLYKFDLFDALKIHIINWRNSTPATSEGYISQSSIEDLMASVRREFGDDVNISFSSRDDYQTPKSSQSVMQQIQQSVMEAPRKHRPLSETTSSMNQQKKVDINFLCNQDIEVKFNYDQEMINVIKTASKKSYNPEKRTWTISAYDSDYIIDRFRLNGYCISFC